jgi:hypothetical protein
MWIGAAGWGKKPRLEFNSMGNVHSLVAAVKDVS